MQRIGITIITGFLGSGKTSLLNQIIEKETEYKFAIIENEFSEFGIDAEIIKGVDNTSVFELSNGCICCTMNTELQETLEELLISQLSFNHLLIETTGIAEPDSIIQSILSSQALKETFYIDSVICLLDAANYAINNEQSEAVKQLALADWAIINKIENAEKDKIIELKEYLHQLSPLCKSIATSHADYGDSDIINSNLFNQADFEKTFSQASVSLKHLRVDVPVKSISVEIEGDFEKEKFEFWMEYFLMLNQSTIFRAKGILRFKNKSRKQIFQAVKAAFTIEDGDFWESGKVGKNRLIFIGKELNEKEIKDGLCSIMND